MIKKALCLLSYMMVGRMSLAHREAILNSIPSSLSNQKGQIYIKTNSIQSKRNKGYLLLTWTKKKTEILRQLTSWWKDIRNYGAISSLSIRTRVSNWTKLKISTKWLMLRRVLHQQNWSNFLKNIIACLNWCKKTKLTLYVSLLTLKLWAKEKTCWL